MSFLTHRPSLMTFCPNKNPGIRIPGLGDSLNSRFKLRTRHLRSGTKTRKS